MTQNRHPETEHEQLKAQHKAQNEAWLRNWSSRAILSLDELAREGEPCAPTESEFEDEHPSRAA